MKIAITSDNHDNWINLEKAVKAANLNRCEQLLFAGDLISPPGIAVLEKFEGQVKLIWGNNEGEKMGITRKADASQKMELCGDYFEGEIDKIKIFLIHSPRLAELAAASQEFDLVIHEHNHDEKREINVGKTLLVNPGGLHLYPGNTPSITIYDTQKKTVESVEI
jgi:uncharacterized protein